MITFSHQIQLLFNFPCSRTVNSFSFLLLRYPLFLGSRFLTAVHQHLQQRLSFIHVFYCCPMQSFWLHCLVDLGYVVLHLFNKHFSLHVFFLDAGLLISLTNLQLSREDAKDDHFGCFLSPYGSQTTFQIVYKLLIKNLHGYDWNDSNFRYTKEKEWNKVF